MHTGLTAEWNEVMHERCFEFDIFQKNMSKLTAGNEGNVFKLNSTTGILSCKELDREHQQEYFLIITAEEQGTPKRAVCFCNYFHIFFLYSKDLFIIAH